MQPSSARAGACVISTSCNRLSWSGVIRQAPDNVPCLVFDEINFMQKMITRTWRAIAEYRYSPLRPVLAGVDARRALKRRAKLEPVPNLSRASACVWQMDREA